MSAETGHTPGPLLAVREHEYRTNIETEGGRCIGAAFGGDVEETAAQHAEIGPNARLWAAAPDLLAALNEALPWVAIATANDDVTAHPQRTANHARALEMARLAIIKATTP